MNNFIGNFGLGMVWFESIWVSDLLSSEPISDVMSGVGPGYSVRVSGLGSILSSPGSISWVFFFWVTLVGENFEKRLLD